MLWPCTNPSSSGRDSQAQQSPYDEHHRALHAGESFEYDSRKLFEKGEYARILKDNNHPVTIEVESAIMDYHR